VRARDRLRWLIAGLLVALALEQSVGFGVVRGLSMWPTLLPGDVVLYVRWLPAAEGDLVVAYLPGHGRIVKRVATVGQAGYFLLGDNLEVSYDSRAWGPFTRNLVLGQVVAVWTGRPHCYPAGVACLGRVG